MKSIFNTSNKGRRALRISDAYLMMSIFNTSNKGRTAQKLIELIGGEW